MANKTTSKKSSASKSARNAPATRHATRLSPRVAAATRGKKPSASSSASKSIKSPLPTNNSKSHFKSGSGKSKAVAPNAKAPDKKAVAAKTDPIRPDKKPIKAADAGKAPTANSTKGAKGGKKTRTVAQAASTVIADSKGYVFINGRRVRMISTKGQLPPKKPRANGGPVSGPAVDTTPIKSIKTKLSRKELNHYRDLLVLKRRELIGDLHAMENEALRSGGGNLSHMPIHMADIGTDTYDQDFMLGLAATERTQLREIDGALQRIEDRSYGVCQMTGKPIPKARLDAKPWAKYTIEAARQLEGQWGP